MGGIGDIGPQWNRSQLPSTHRYQLTIASYAPQYIHHYVAMQHLSCSICARLAHSLFQSRAIRILSRCVAAEPFFALDVNLRDHRPIRHDDVTSHPPRCITPSRRRPRVRHCHIRRG